MTKSSNGMLKCGHAPTGVGCHSPLPEAYRHENPLNFYITEVSWSEDISVQEAKGQ